VEERVKYWRTSASGFESGIREFFEGFLNIAR